MYKCLQDGSEGEYTVHFNSYEEGGKVGKPDSVKVDAVIGADGANSRVAKEIDAGMLSPDRQPLWFPSCAMLPSRAPQLAFEGI